MERNNRTIYFYLVKDERLFCAARLTNGYGTIVDRIFIDIVCECQDNQVFRFINFDTFYCEPLIQAGSSFLLFSSIDDDARNNDEFFSGLDRDIDIASLHTFDRDRHTIEYSRCNFLIRYGYLCDRLVGRNIFCATDLQAAE